MTTTIRSIEAANLVRLSIAGKIASTLLHGHHLTTQKVLDRARKKKQIVSALRYGAFLYAPLPHLLRNTNLNSSNKISFRHLNTALVVDTLLPDLPRNARVECQ